MREEGVLSRFESWNGSIELAVDRKRTGGRSRGKGGSSDAAELGKGWDGMGGGARNVMAVGWKMNVKSDCQTPRNASPGDAVIHGHSES